MRVPLTPLMTALVALLFALAPPLEAQILKVHFTDEKAAKKFKKYTCELDGETVFVGEAVPGGGVLINYKGGQFAGASHKSNADNDFFILDPGDPSKVPYKMENGEPVPLKKSSVVTIHGKYIDRMTVMMRSETIETIAREYRLRAGRVDELKEARDDYDKGSVEWFVQHRLMLGGYERLISWLDSLSFTELADETRKEYEKEAKRSSEEATAVRAQRALDSVKALGTPDELANAATTVGGDKYHFAVGESQHIRITYQTERVSEAQAKELLAFGEKLIEGFRNQFVDPYVSDTFAERVPDGRFIEYFFGPDDVEFHRKFVEQYYGVSWGRDEEDRQRSLETAGKLFIRGMEPRLLNTWRMRENFDFEGTITHIMGHTLASLHFGGGVEGMSQPWLQEGLGYYLSFEFLGRNSVTCVEFRESLYVSEEGEGGYKEVQMGYRDILMQVALEQGERIDRVMLKYLADMENPDLAKSWSFLEYLARDGGLDGQRWMRAACDAGKDRAKFLETLRTYSEEIFNVTGQDVFKVMDERWRKYAEAEKAKDY